MASLPGLQRDDAKELVFDKVARLLRTPEELLDAHDAVFGSTPGDVVCRRVLAATALTEFGSDRSSLGVGVRAAVLAHQEGRGLLQRSPSEPVQTLARQSVNQMDPKARYELYEQLKGERRSMWAQRLLEPAE